MSETETDLSCPAAEEAAAGPGRRLADARQLQSLSAADVARQLKLSVWQVEALEAGQYEKLPGPIFVRGFIRNYARLVKLDSEELVRTAAEHLPIAASRPEVPPSKDIPFAGKAPRPWPIYGAIVVAIVGLLAVYEFYWSGAETIVVKPVPEVAQPVSPQSAPPVAKASGPEVPAPAAVAEGAATDRQGITVAVAAPAAREAPAAEVPAAVPGAGGPPQLVAGGPPQPGARVVRLVFEEESWVEIRDRSGDAIFTKLNPRGTVQEVRGMPPLAVVVGNAHGVRMTYDDQPVDLVRHTRVDVARLTLE